jgi:T-complex protein 1 subunit theta
MLLQVALRLRGAISSKQLGYEDLLAPLIAEACIDVVPTNPHNFNVDNVRIVKIMGGALPDSQVRFNMLNRLNRCLKGNLNALC